MLSAGEDVADWIPRVRGDRVGDEGIQAVHNELSALVDAAPVIAWDSVEDRPPASAADSGAGAEYSMPLPEWPSPPDNAAFHGLEPRPATETEEAKAG